MLSKYAPLRRYLESAGPDRLRLSFADIEAVLGFALPSSAKQYPQWWANVGGSHVQAEAWLGAGWRTCDVDVPSQAVSFERKAAAATRRDVPGVEDAGAPFIADDAIVLRRATLRGGAIRMLEDYREAQGGDLGDAAAALLNAMALERRRQLLERFPLSGAPSSVDSAALILEERDAR